MQAMWHYVMTLSPAATRLVKGVNGACSALRAPCIGVVLHTDTGPGAARGSVTLLRIMRFGLLLLSCRGEGL